MENKFKPIICVDFDGVIHSYDNGWQDGEIYGEVVDGFFDWVSAVKENFSIYIYSSRSKDQDGIDAMKLFLRKEYEKFLAYKEHISYDIFDVVAFAHEKPPAYLTIDDRAICFNGDWNARELTVNALQDFKPWNKRTKNMKQDFINDFQNREKPVEKIVVAVQLLSGATEIIINSDDIQSKYEYYCSAYDDEMRLKNNTSIQITGWLFV